MTLDEIAAAVVAVEADDLKELARIHEELAALRDVESASPRERELTGNALDLIEAVILRECNDPATQFTKVGELITFLQKLADGETLDDSWVEEQHETGDSNAEAPTEATPSAASLMGADKELLGEFATESQDHLEMAEGALLDLETNPEDTESINAVFRAFHTIKGTSGFMGLDRINAVAHKAETLLDRARQGEIRIEGAYADLALDSVDVLKNLVDQVSASLGGDECEEPEGVDELLARLDAPDQEMPREPEQLRVGDVLVAREKADREDVERVAELPGDKKIGEKLVREGVASAKDVVNSLRTQKQAVRTQKGEGTLRVSMERLDSLIDMVGELVIAETMVSQDPAIVEAKSQDMLRKVGHLGKITRELQDLTLAMRMVPLQGTFRKMARLVRDLGRKAGKKIRFVTEGEDTEIDRNMVESINDPLVHMMRNATDHGIELPEERLSHGKSEDGRVTLRAYHSAGSVVIQVQDDGEGIDPDKVLAKAIERGLVEPGKELSRSEIFDFLMAPGFSTAEKVTDVSGRGVGMDVVRKNIEAMRGRVEISSTKGEGSVFTVRLPLTLAIIDGMLMSVGIERHILPTLNIQQAFLPKAGDISTVQGKGEVVMLRGELIPVFRLYEIFGISGAQTDPTKALLVVVEHEGEKCALLADALLGQQQVVIKSLGEALGDISGISGAAIQGDGRVGLIIDVVGLLQLARGIDGREEEAA